MEIGRKKDKRNINDIMFEDQQKAAVGQPKKQIFTDIGGIDPSVVQPEEVFIPPNETTGSLEIIKYNENTLKEPFLDSNPLKDDIVLRNGLILVKLFKNLPFYRTSSGMVMAKPLTTTQPKPSGQGFKNVSDPLAYSNVGIVINIDPAMFNENTLTEDMKINVGDIVVMPENSVRTVWLSEAQAIFDPSVRRPLTMFSLEGGTVDSNNFAGYVLVQASSIIMKRKNFNPNNAKN